MLGKSPYKAKGSCWSLLARY